MLHECSNSDAVARTAKRAREHAEESRRLIMSGREADVISGLDAIRGVSVDVWLTASVGLPDSLAAALLTVTSSRPAPIIRVDLPDAHFQPRVVPYFRAPARLTLPGDSPIVVGVAALVVRPGRSSTHLILAGAYQWPAEEHDVIRALERIVQPFADQWFATHPLWDVPAEIQFPEEIR